MTITNVNNTSLHITENNSENDIPLTIIGPHREHVIANVAAAVGEQWEIGVRAAEPSVRLILRVFPSISGLSNSAASLKTA
jgi:hypothetical protein